ncbi:hypothetical protein ACFTT0_04070 [Streptomyces bauhiniae]|uniref:hypothetical protein n=1 Tax=Streptomyces bauhiniae TaxID=2340725 RepID=UPI00363DDDEA
MTTAPGGDGGDRLTDRLRLRRYAFLVVILLSLLLSVGLISFDHKTSKAQQLGALGTGIAGSAIFALIISWLLDAEHDRFLQTQLSGRLDAQQDAILAEFRKLNARYLPLRDYAPTQEYRGNRFNADLTASLEASGSYTFRGASAKYVAPRIRHNGDSITRVRVVMIDPQSQDALSARAADRLSNPKYAGRTLQQIMEGLREETFRSIVSLHGISSRVRVEIGLSAAVPSVVRVEMFDSDVYVSVYNMETSLRSHFPGTQRYSSESLVYMLQRLEGERVYDLCAKKLVFDRQTTDEQLIQTLQLCGMTHADETSLAAIRQRNEQFEAAFTRDALN